MLKKKYLFCIVCLFLLCHCKDKSDHLKEAQIIEVDMDKDLVEILDLSLIKDYRLVRLETLDEALIGDIEKVEIYDQYMYLLDKTNRGGIVFIFDTIGNYLHKINNYGKAGNEYLQLTGMWVDKEKQTLNLSSRMDKKWFVYSLNGEKLLQVKKLPKVFVEAIGNDKYLLGYSGNYTEDRKKPYNAWLLDSNAKIINNFFEISPGWESANLSSGQVLSTYKETFFYIEPLNFYVNQITIDGQLKNPYYFDFGKYHWPLTETSYRERKEIQDNGGEYVDRIYRLQETDDFLFATFLFRGQKRCVVYEKSTGKVDVCELNGDRKKFFISFGTIVNINEDYIITTINTSIIKSLSDLSIDDYPEQVERMNTLFPNIKEDDNPFIVIYSL